MGFPKSHHVSYNRFTVKFTRRRARFQWHFIYYYYFSLIQNKRPSAVIEPMP